MSTKNPQLVTADSALRRLRAVGDWLAALEPNTEVLVLAPTHGAADDLLRRFAPQGRGLFGVHRLTLKQFAADLATPALADDAPGLPRALRATLRELPTEGHPYRGSVCQSPVQEFLAAFFTPKGLPRRRSQQ